QPAHVERHRNDKGEEDGRGELPGQDVAEIRHELRHRAMVSRDGPRPHRAFRLLKPRMASQTHDSARAARSAARGEYPHFERKLRGRWCELRDATREAL